MPDNNWQGIKVTSGATDSITLLDGSMAYLKGPAELGFPKVFDKDVRKVKMQGEIYFEIAKDPNRTFLIQSEKGGLETHGANVLVNTKEKKNITIYCLKNNVRMIARGKKKIFEINLEAHEMSSFSKGDGLIEKEPFDPLTLSLFKY